MNVVFCSSLTKIFADNKMWMQQSQMHWSDVPPFGSEMVATFSRAFLDFYMLFIAFVDDMFAVYDKNRLISAAFILSEHFFFFFSSVILAIQLNANGHAEFGGVAFTFGRSVGRKTSKDAQIVGIV